MSRLLRFFVAPPDGAPPPARIAVRREIALPRSGLTVAAGPAPEPAFAPPRAPALPPARPVARPVAAPADAGGVAVLARPGDLEMAAGAAAALLRSRGGLPAACVWAPGEPDPVCLPPLPGATRLARRLAERGLDATACGALARIRLDDDPERAAAEVGRARAVLGGSVGLALARRDPALDPLLAAAGTVLVVELEHAALTALAIAEASGLNPAAELVARPAAIGARLRLRLGLHPPACTSAAPAVAGRAP